MPRHANGDKVDNKAREGAGYERVPLFPEPGDFKDGDPYLVNAIDRVAQRDQEQVQVRRKVWALRIDEGVAAGKRVPL